MERGQTLLTKPIDSYAVIPLKNPLFTKIRDAEIFVQILDLFSNRGSPLELVDCKVEWIHAVSNYHSKPVKFKHRSDTTLRQRSLFTHHHWTSGRAFSKGNDGAGYFSKCYGFLK